MSAAPPAGESLFPPLQEDRQVANPDPEDLYQDWLKKMRGWLLVVATLVATCAYTASLSPPGGYWQEDNLAENQIAGTSILEDKTPKRYAVFRLFNSMAQAQSFAIIIIVMRKTSYYKGGKSLVRALQILTVGSIASICTGQATLTVVYYYFKINVVYLVVIFLILAEFITWLQPPFSKFGRQMKDKFKSFIRKVRPEEEENEGTRCNLWTLMHVVLRLGIVAGLVLLSIEDSRSPHYWGNWQYKTGLAVLVLFGILLWWFGK